MKKRRVAALAAAMTCGVIAAVSFSSCDLFHPTPDYNAWSASISQKTMTASLCVQKKSNRNPGQGSGMIFYESATMYYALTNNHVVHRQYNETVSYTVVDCFDKEYTSASIVYESADYDLAVIQFAKSSNDLEVTPLAKRNPASNQAVALIGNPKGRHNSLTFGKVWGYEKVTISDVSAEKSNIRFDVVKHNCFSSDGSSGGAVVNEALEIVAVHYACGYDLDGEYVEGYAIPVEKIKEFLLIAEVEKGIELGV